MALLEKHDYDTADALSKNFGFHRVANYSCYSYLDPSIAELFVRPGGEYWGTPVKYNASRVPWSTLVFGGDSDLTKYVVKAPQTQSRRASTCNYDAFVAAVEAKKATTGPR